MAVLRARSKLVTFRLSEQEHAALQHYCVRAGARSMSDVAREAVLRTIQIRSGRGTLDKDISSLLVDLEELDTKIADVSQLIARLLGSRRHD